MYVLFNTKFTLKITAILHRHDMIYPIGRNLYWNLNFVTSLVANSHYYKISIIAYIPYRTTPRNIYDLKHWSREDSREFLFHEIFHTVGYKELKNSQFAYNSVCDVDRSEPSRKIKFQNSTCTEVK